MAACACAIASGFMALPRRFSMASSHSSKSQMFSAHSDVKVRFLGSGLWLTFNQQNQKCVDFLRVYAASSEAQGAQGQNFRNWARNLKKQEPVGERIVRMVSTATSSPLAQYIAAPVTILHSLDPRVKQAWLLALVVLPSRANMVFRLGIAGLLILATVLNLPRRVWQDQLGRMAFLSALLFITVALGTDGFTPVVQVRTPPPALESLPSLPPSLSGYSYVLFKFGPLQLTTKGVALAATASCLSFTVLQSASLCLATTTPEQLAAGLQWFLRPLASIGIAVDEMILTLLLSLRFIGLVFDEVRNIALGVVARGVQWKSLNLRETLDYVVNILAGLGMLVSRLFKNLFIHAEHIAEAMVARGFRGNPEKHRLYFLRGLSVTMNDILALAALGSLCVAAAASEILLHLDSIISELRNRREKESICISKCG